MNYRYRYSEIDLKTGRVTEYWSDDRGHCMKVVH